MTSPGLSYEDYLRSKKDEEQDDFSYEAYLRQKPRGVISEFTRGLATGGLQAATTTGEVFGVGRGSTEAVEEYFDPRGTAGRAGQVIGRIGGEIGTSFLGGGLLLKGAAKIPKAAKALEGMSAARRALAVGAIQAPVDVVQGAKEEEGIFLPGRAGSIVESVALGQVAPALQARRAARTAREAAAARAAAANAPIEILPAAQVELLPEAEETFRQARAAREEARRAAQRAERAAAAEVPGSPLAETEQLRRAKAGPEDVELLPWATEAAERGGRVPSTFSALGEATQGPRSLGQALDEALRLDDPTVAFNAMEGATARLAEAAAQAGVDAPKPLIEVVESSARGSQPFRYDARNKTYRLYGTNRTQARYLKSIEDTATRLEKEAARLRAFPEPDMDAVRRLEAAAEEGRQMREALSPGGLILRPGALSSELLAQGGGALTGALAGAATADTEDRADVIGRAALGAAAGFGLGRSAARGFPSASKLAEALRRGEVDRQTVIEGRMRKAGSVGEAKLFEPTISPAVAKMVDEQATQVEKELAASGVFRESKSLKDMTKEGERFLNSLAPGARTIMTDEEFAARAARIGRREDALSQVTAKMSEDGLSPDTVAFLQDAHKRIFNAIVADAEVVQPALSSAGRRMNIARQMGARDVRSALNTAKSLLDIPAGADLSDAVKEQIRAVFARPQAEQAEALQRVYQSIAKRTIWEQVTNSRVVGLLSTPATWLVNILGSTAESAQNAIAHPVALALDAAYSKVAGKRRTIAGLSRGKDWLDTFVASGKRVANPKALRNMLDGIPADSVYGNLERIKGSYVTDWGLQNPGATAEQAESAFRKAARMGARTLDVISNGIYGVMETADIPFYRAALATGLKERAAVRALNEGLGNNPEAFAKRVQELLTPDGANVVDQMLATADALDATYKSTTGAGQAIRALEQGVPALGGALRFMVPFANTPTNIIRKALEGVPGVGTVMTAAQNKRVASKMRRLGATAEQVSDEMRRRYINNIARQATTGAGGIAAGFALHQAGVLTPAYVAPRGATDAEKEEMQRRALTGEAPLSIRIGDTSMSLGYLGTLAPALAIGAAMSQAVKDDAERGVGTVAVPAAMATARTFLDMPLLKGVSGLADIASQGPDRLPVELGKQVGSFVPSAVAAVARGADPLQRARPETFGEAIAERIPVLRERLAPRVGAFGETQEGVGLLRSLIDPTRPQKIRTGGIYEQLEQLEVYPGQRARREGESAEQYAARRAYEGEREKRVLEGILSGSSPSLRNVSASARRNFRRTVEERGEEAAVRELLAIALRQQRAEMTAADKKTAERQARREGYRRNTTEFTSRVNALMAGQP
jgi:hypothetical protein